MVHQFCDSKILLNQTRRSGVGKRRHLPTGLIDEQDSFAASRKLTLVITLDEKSPAPARAGGSRSPGFHVGRDVERSRGRNHDATVERVIDSAGDLPPG